MKNVHIISIEGNIGSGKSTLLEHLKRDLAGNKHVVFVEEPLDIWQTIVDKDTGKTMLELYYADQKRHGYAFQMMAYISRLQKMKEAYDSIPEGVLITERSLLSDHHIFAKMLYDQGVIESAHYQIYMKWFEYFANTMPPTKTVYLRCDPEIAKERIAKRNRDGESGISLDYLQNLNKYHDDWLNGTATYHLNGNLHRTDDFVDMLEYLIKETPLKDYVKK